MKLFSHIIDRIRESLFGKFLVIFGLFIISGSSIFLYLSGRSDRRDLMENSLGFISSFSEMIHNSIRQEMLSNNRAELQRSLESIGATASIKRVSIFDRNGVIHYSSDKKLIGSRADRASASCIGCHSDPTRPLETLTKEGQWTIYTDNKNHRFLSFIEPIYNEPSCSTAWCHAHENSDRVLGFLITDFSLNPIDRRIKDKMMSNLLLTLVLLIIGPALLYLIIWRYVFRPIGVLSDSMERVATSGDLSQAVPDPTKDEIGKLAQTFNSMIGELKVSRQKMESWAQTLEAEVDRKTAEIKNTQGKLIEAEKMAALGRLTADIAHEIRNPLSALGGFGRRLQKITVNEKEKEYSDIIVSEVARLEHVLKDVLLFSKESKYDFQRMPVTSVVKDAVKACSDLCSERSINIVNSMNSDIPVLLDPVHARQALDNLIYNAIDAMPDGGVLTIGTETESVNYIKYLVVNVSDTGPGIPDDKIPLVFEPFHTSKKIGYGTGLGLSITRKVMDEHGGFIKAQNNDGPGITFSLYFPHQTEEDLGDIPCWEFMKCGRDINSETKCPACPDFGRVCWVVAGTFCHGKVQGTFAQKHEDCKKCPFFKHAVKNEAAPGYS